jgi:hypothetical protein
MVKIEMDRSSTAEEVQEGGERSAAETAILRRGYQGWCRRHYHVHEDLCVEASEACTRLSARDWQQTGGSEKMVVGEKRNGVVWLAAGRGDKVQTSISRHNTTLDKHRLRRLHTVLNSTV